MPPFSIEKLMLLFLLVLTSAGCNKSGPRSDSAKSENKFDPCEQLRQTNPHCGWTPHWDDSGISTNAIDGTKTEFLSLESTDAEGINFGKLHYAELRICFENGVLCGRSVGISVTVHGMIQSLGYETGQRYSTPVRLKFDDEKALRQTWGIADSHDTLFPHGREKQFLSQLLQHQKFILEFSYYEKAPTTVTFELSGLADKMKSAGLQDPTPQLEAIRKANSEAQAVEEKRLDRLHAECAPFVGGSPEMVQTKKMPLPPEKCREVLPWLRDAYLDALYELQEQAH